jgi:hypothetical protein
VTPETLTVVDDKKMHYMTADGELTDLIEGCPCAIRPGTKFVISAVVHKKSFPGDVTFKLVDRDTGREYVFDKDGDDFVLSLDSAQVIVGAVILAAPGAKKDTDYVAFVEEPAMAIKPKVAHEGVDDNPYVMTSHYVAGRKNGEVFKGWSGKNVYGAVPLPNVIAMNAADKYMRVFAGHPKTGAINEKMFAVTKDQTVTLTAKEYSASAPHEFKVIASGAGPDSAFTLTKKSEAGDVTVFEGVANVTYTSAALAYTNSDQGGLLRTNVDFIRFERLTIEIL